MTPESKIVLVAEDEALIRMIADEFLTSEGFEVIAVANAAEALDILHQQAGTIHALFTDVHMPGAMSGLDLARHAHENWPWIALLVASGQARPAGTDMPPGSRFLPKPYDFSQAVAHIREMVAAD